MTLLCYYVIGLPLAIYLGFYAGYHINGFWYGYIVAMAIVDLIVVVIVIKSKWEANFVFEAKSSKGLTFNENAPAKPNMLV